MPSKQFALLLLFLLLLSLSVRGGETATRLAILSDTGAEDLAALMSTHLPQITLLERDELARIGDEQRLRELARSDSRTLGQMAGSDGLLFLSREKGEYRARLTAVHLGFTLFDVAFAPEAPLEEIARRLRIHLETLRTKLTLTVSKALPLTVLNLRVDRSSSTAHELERDATLLLENGLAQLPQVVLLERRRPQELAFERSLNPATPELLRGVYLIDGTIAPPVTGTSLQATLRIRSPDGYPLTTFTVEGESNNLSPFTPIALNPTERNDWWPRGCTASTRWALPS